MSVKPDAKSCFNAMGELMAMFLFQNAEKDASRVLEFEALRPRLCFSNSSYSLQSRVCDQAELCRINYTTASRQRSGAIGNASEISSLQEPVARSQPRDRSGSLRTYFEFAAPDAGLSFGLGCLLIGYLLSSEAV